MAKKKDKPQIINNIGELNLEIDYDKLAESIVKAQEKSENEANRKIKFTSGTFAMIISFGTIVSSLMSDRLTKKIGTAKVTAFSVLLTALALFGFSISNNFWFLVLFSIPYGIGAGGVDASLNNYVALHYSSKHMSFLHAMWGVGTCIGPNVLSFFLLIARLIKSLSA